MPTDRQSTIFMTEATEYLCWGDELFPMFQTFFYRHRRCLWGNGGGPERGR